MSTTLTAIRNKVRKLTGRPSSSQITDSEIDDYVNTYYQYDFPQELKVFNLKTTYSFYTQPNQDQYTFTPDLYYSLEQPVYVSGFQANFYENRELFFRVYPKQFTEQTFATSSGAAGPYAGSVTGTPFLAGEVLISTVSAAGPTFVVTDDGFGNLVGDCLAGSTVNYLTGAINVTFTGATLASSPVNCKFVPYSASRPLSVLYYENTLTIRPVPDDSYKIELQAFIKPTALINPAGSPLLQEYWQLLSYGAASKVFADNLDMENYSKVLPFIKEQLNFVQRRTLMQIKNQRTATIYSENMFWSGQRYPST